MESFDQPQPGWAGNHYRNVGSDRRNCLIHQGSGPNRGPNLTLDRPFRPKNGQSNARSPLREDRPGYPTRPGDLLQHRSEGDLADAARRLDDNAEKSRRLKHVPPPLHVMPC